LTLFAVCDGHGGPEVANLVAKLLPVVLKKELEEMKSNYHQAFISAFRKLDDLICSQKG
jgi:serine/threonine protein phosphatase PrpC